MTPASEAGYSAVADQQLTDLETRGPTELFLAAVDTCESILDNPSAARRRAAAIQTKEGIRFRTPVNGFPDLKVFWSSDGPRIEAIFPYPT
jgi:hypothetical protein